MSYVNLSDISWWQTETLRIN